MTRNDTPASFKMTECGLIPREWAARPFENCVVGRKKTWRNLSQSEYSPMGRYPIVDQGRELVSGYSDDESATIVDDLPVIVFGDHTRALKYVDFPFICGPDGTKLLFPDKSTCDPKFLYFALTRLDIPARGYNRHYSLLREKTLPIPPLEEQRRIAAILSSAQSAKEKTEATISALKELKKSMMKHLFTYGPIGRQDTHEVSLKETHAGRIPEAWTTTKLGDVSIEVNSGLTPRGGQKTYIPSGVPLVRSQNVLMNKVSLDDVAYISTETHSMMRSSQVHPGDVLLNITGASIGRVAVMPKEPEVANVNQHVCRIRLDERADPDFVSYFLSSPAGQSQIWGTQSGTTRQGLNYGKVKALTLPLPPLETQKMIGRMLTASDAGIATVESCRTSSETLFSSLLDVLMTGKLRVNNLEVPT